MIFKSDPDDNKAEHTTFPCTRFRGPGNRFCLAPGVQVQLASLPLARSRLAAGWGFP